MSSSIKPLILISIGFFFFLETLPAQAPARPRILILDFVNQKHDAATRFLIQSIPNAFMKPLEETKSFDILDSQKGRALITTSGISADQLYDIATAVQLGKTLHADIVIIGNFVAIQNRVQVQTQAIEVASERVKVSESEVAISDSTIFGSIDALTERMSKKIKTEFTSVAAPVAPKPQRFYRRKDYGLMVGLTAVAPGAGHLYAEQWRGGVYATLAVASGIGFIFGQIFYSSNSTAYQNTTTDFDKYYDRAQDWKKVRGYSSYVFLATYAIALFDILITGQSYTKILAFQQQKPEPDTVHIILAGPALRGDQKNQRSPEDEASVGVMRYF